MGYLKIPGTEDHLFDDLTPAKALEKIKELQAKGEIPKGEGPRGDFSC